MKSKPTYPSKENFSFGGKQEEKQHLGMALREHYAGLAMQAYYSTKLRMGMEHPEIAACCVDAAEALINELNRRHE